MTLRMHSYIAACAAVLVLGGCSSDPHPLSVGAYGVVLGYRDVSYNPRHPFAIIMWIDSADGKRTGSRDVPIRLPPGSHRLVVACSYKWLGIMANGTQRNLTLDVEAGHIYRLRPIVKDRGRTCQIKVSE